MIPIGKIVILSFSNSEEHILHEIMQIIRMQPEFQIRDMVLNDEILDFGKTKNTGQDEICDCHTGRNSAV